MTSCTELQQNWGVLSRSYNVAGEAKVDLEIVEEALCTLEELLLCLPFCVSVVVPEVASSHNRRPKEVKNCVISIDERYRAWLW